MINVSELRNRKNIAGRFLKMRKPQEFTVYPTDKGDTHIVVQSDKSIGRFEIESGKGILNVNGNRFLHLTGALGAVEFEFPQDFVRACREVAGV